jgi:hypothetical protein
MDRQLNPNRSHLHCYRYPPEMDPATHDAQLRQAAFSHVNRLATLRGGVLDSADLAVGFDFEGDRIPLINPQRGIFKPRQMEHLLSIKTVFLRRGARARYDDQLDAHRQIYAGDDVVDYAFMGTDPDSPDNRWLLDAMLRCSRRSRSSISSARRRVTISPSSRHSSWIGILSACGFSLPSG